jgi:photosystem II stability/assembly factor-like uncharacterized protein
MKRFKKASFITAFVMMFCLSSIQAAPADMAGPGWRLAFQGTINWPTNFMGFMNEKDGITVGANGECHYTNDGGKSWPRGNNRSHCRYRIDTLGDSIAWSCGNVHARFTQDGGKNWEQMADPGFSAEYISFIDLTTGWIGSSLNNLVVTNDAGAHWSPIETPGQSNQMSGIALLSATSGYVLIQEPDASVLYLTEDCGKTWQKQSTVCQGTLPILTMRFFDSRQGIIIGSSERKMVGFITVDGGKTWRTESVFSKVSVPYLTRDGKTLTLLDFDNVYYVLIRK